MRVASFFFFILFSFHFFPQSLLFAQDSAQTVSQFQSAPLDTFSVSRDTTKADTVKPASPKRVSGVDSVVVYSSKDSIVYSFDTRTMRMFGNGDVRYREMRLKSEEIDVNWETSTMHARGVLDTADTSGRRQGLSGDRSLSSFESKVSEKKKYRGTPVMKDGGEEYHGFELSYNFKTQKGKIDVGDTQVDQGYYHGEAIKKVEKDVLFVEDGRYTTCDAEDPHYYFFSPKMKVVMQDRVVAEPLYLYIADVPVFALPFGVFPNKGGRRSGIIAPAYGEDGRRGRYLSHLGYYWAMNDYMDWNMRGDWYTRGGWALYTDYRYALRYNFAGSLSGDYKNLYTGESSDPDRTEEQAYRVNITHHQDIDPTTRLDANFTFASNNSYLATSNLQQALEQAIFSNATLNKFWEGTPNSMSINVSRRQNLRDGSIDETLPSIGFNRSQSYPFRPSRKGGSSFGGESSESAWYEMIGYSYGAQFNNARSKTNQKVSGIKDTTSGVAMFNTVEEFSRSNRQNLTQNIGVNVSPKLGYFTLTPSASFRDERFWSSSSTPQRSAADSSLVFADDKDFQANGFFSTGIATSTRFYGILQPNMFGIGAFRHTVNPSLSLSYSKQVYGRNLPPKQMVASFNVGNIFEMKTATPVGSSNEEENGGGEKKEETKIQLLNLGTGISYNFTADSLNFSPIGVSFRTDIANVLNVSGSSNFDLYKFDEASGQRVNKFLINEEGRLARMTNFNLNLSTTLSGEKKKKSGPVPAAADSSGQMMSQKSGYYGLHEEEEPDLSIPWSLNLAWDFSESKVPNARFRSSNLRGSLGFNLTEHWKISANGSYDILNKEFAAPSIDIYRDLHCWEMSFNWVPIGTYRGFRFEIRIKASQLQDVKVTKQRSGRSIY